MTLIRRFHFAATIVCGFGALPIIAGGNASCKKNQPEPAATSKAERNAPVTQEPELGLVVASTGAEPRIALRYATTGNEPFALAFNTETKTSKGNLVSSTMNVIGTIAPTFPTDGASTASEGRLDVAVAGVTATDRERQLVDAAGINFYLKDWKPPTFSLGVTANGNLSPDETNWRWPDILFNQHQALHDSVGQWFAVLPDAPIGAGATWTLTKRDIVNGVALLRITHYELAAAGPAAEIRATFTETAKPQQTLLEGSPLDLVSYRATGTATYKLQDAGAWIGAASGTIEVDMVFKGSDQTDVAIKRATGWTLGPPKPAPTSAPATAGRAKS